MADEKILSYNDVVLRRSDLEILSGPYFLNDRIIEFYFSVLSSTHSTQEEILLVPPSIAFWLTNCPDTAGLIDFSKPLKLPEKKLIIFPINNNDDVSLAEGGTHWSLLAYYRNAGVFVHHDSNGQMNKRHAMRLFQSVSGFVGDSDVKYVECVESPQQINGYDCGLYVIATARSICRWHEGCGGKDGDDNLWVSALKEQVTPSVVGEMRKEILELIKDLMAKE